MPRPQAPYELAIRRLYVHNRDQIIKLSEQHNVQQYDVVDILLKKFSKDPAFVEALEKMAKKRPLRSASTRAKKYHSKKNDKAAGKKVASKKKATSKKKAATGKKSLTKKTATRKTTK